MNDSSVGFVIPSYNESQNILLLINEIRHHFKDSYIVIVDDSVTSEKRKIEKILTLFSKDKKIHFISRKKKSGRGSAVITGFKYLQENKKIMYFFELDADLSHSPKEARRFLTKIKKNDYDLVIGSRYLTESKIIKWVKWRVILSRIINNFLNHLLNLHLTDYTNGYRLYKRNAIEYLLKIRFRSNGFILLSETAYRLSQKGFKISEIPITFVERKHGTSSVGNRELFSSLINILIIRFGTGRNIKIFSLSTLLFFALILRLWGLNAVGRAWDEPAYVEIGYKMIEQLKKGNLNDKAFDFYDHPPLARYSYGIGSQIDLEGFEKNGDPIFKYDYTGARLVSLFFSLLSILLVALFGWKYISPFVGLSAGVILAMSPIFLGYSQIATLESPTMLFFTASVFAFINLLYNYSKKNIMLTGVLVGLALEVKQSSIFIFPLFIVIYLIWYILKNKQERRKSIRPIFISFFSIVIISIITFFILWPATIFNFNESFYHQKTMWFSDVKLPPPEVFYGKLMLVPIVYFPVYFAISIPFFIIILFLVGMKVIDIRKKFVLYAVLVWFILPFFQSLYPFKQHGLRYIIQIYAPLALIAGLGLEYLVNKFSGSFKVKTISLIILVFYLFVILYRISPYYLDYFNALTGGVNGVYESKLFQFGSWGQGFKEAGEYLRKNTPNDSSVGLAISPYTHFPNYSEYRSEKYDEGKQYDYVVVNYFNVLREGFDDTNIKKNYKLIHQVFADRAPLIDIYKREK